MTVDLPDELFGGIAKLGYGSGFTVWRTRILLLKSRLDPFAHAGRIESSPPDASTEILLERHDECSDGAIAPFETGRI